MLISSANELVGSVKGPDLFNNDKSKPISESFCDGKNVVINTFPSDPLTAKPTTPVGVAVVGSSFYAPPPKTLTTVTVPAFFRYSLTVCGT